MRTCRLTQLASAVLAILVACDSPTSEGADSTGPPDAPAPARLDFVTSPPQLVSAGDEFTVRVRILDVLGNVIPTAQGELTLAVASGQCSAVPSVSSSVVSSGQATITGVSLDRAGYGFRLEASFGGVSGQSDPFTVFSDGLWEEGEWHPTGQLQAPRLRHSAALLQDGTVLIAGGANVQSPIAERFDPRSGQFSDVGPTHSSHVNGSTMVPLADGSVVLFGGTLGRVVERFVPNAAQFEELPSPVASRLGAGMVTLPDGRVLLTGGFERGNAHDVVEFFDPASEQFVSGPPLPERRSGHATTLLPDGKVLLAGGSQATDGIGAPLMSAWLLDPVAGSYLPLPDASLAFTKAVGLRDGRVLLGNPFHFAGIELYDSGHFSGIIPTSALHLGGTFTPLPDGSILLAGGFQQWASGFTNEVELFDPSTNTVMPLAPMSTSRTRHTATVLLDGRVLVAGGQGTESTAELFVPPTCYGV
jgi:hypothetical protein